MALTRLKQFLSFQAKKVLINSHIISNFNYCPLVWMFLSVQSVNKIEHLQKRALRFLYHDFEASFYEDLLSKVWKSTINVRRLRTLCIQICKKLDDLNPIFMNVFKLKINDREVRDKYKFNFPNGIKKILSIKASNLEQFTIPR